MMLQQKYVRTGAYLGLALVYTILKALKGRNTEQQHEKFVLYRRISFWKSENRKPVTWTVMVGVLESNLLQEKEVACELRQKHIPV